MYKNVYKCKWFMFCVFYKCINIGGVRNWLCNNYKGGFMLWIFILLFVVILVIYVSYIVMV